MKLRDASNVLKSVSAIHMRDAANVLRVVPAIHMRDAANALKSAYASGGGGGGTPPVTITPASKATTSATAASNTSTFTATFSGGPTSIVWSLENIVGGTANVFSGQGTATAQITVTASDIDVPASCTIRCTAIIGGVTYSGTATKQHTLHDFGGGGGGGGGGFIP